MKKLFKKLALMVVALLTFSVGSNYTVKEVKAADTTPVATFDFGANGSASHSDGGEMNSSTNEYTDGSYKLTFSAYSKVYKNARDAKGNSCLKLGTGSAAGSLTFTAPSDVTSISMFVAGYKATSAKVTVGGSNYTISTLSNNGDYTEITLDSSITKTFTFKTLSGGYRCMINTITYCISESSGGETPEPEQPKPSITISGNSYTQIGENLTLTAKEENTTGSVEWTSSDNTVATVNNGVVTPVSMGKVTITASVDDVEDSHEITVYPEANSELTIAKAIEVCELTGESATPYTYKTTGTVTSFEWSDKYSNYETTIEDETGKMGTYGTSGTGELYIGANITVTGSLQNYKGNPQFGIGSTYILNENEELKQVREELNTVDSYMSLAYSYKATTTTEEVVIPSSVEDVLTRELTGKTNTSYGDWEDSLLSGATYKGYSAGSNNSIQLRSDKSTSGIVTTTSGGKVSKITVVWNSNTADGRTLDVYGKSTAYENPTDLYNFSTQGTKLGSVIKGTSTELIIAGDYEYIGLRSASGAMYLTSISIEWNTESENGETEIKEVTTLSDSEFFIRCGADTSIANIENVENYGIRISANGKTVDYSSAEYTLGLEETSNPNYYYIVIKLGDIINNNDRLQTKFSVCAYVEYDGMKYTSEKVKEYSVADMVKEYYTNGSEETKAKVEHLYNYLVEQGLIA